MKVVGVIPSRYKSSRFPGKPLIDILGKSMIQRVYEQCKKCSLLSEVIVATDDKRIYNHILEFGGKAMMTLETHKSGTDRCNEVAQKLYANYDLIVNIQGDEPFIKPEQIDQVASLFMDPATKIGTLAKQITTEEEIFDYNIAKVIFNNQMLAQTFTRSESNALTVEGFLKPIPQKNYYKHIGIYAFKTKVLNEICKLPQSKNEDCENLEQLRWLDNGSEIKVGITTFESMSVDTPEDIIRIEAKMR